MKVDLANIISKRPYYLLLLPIFFVLHGFMENLGVVPAKDAIELLGIYLFSTGLVLLLIWLVMRNLPGAAFYTFLLMCFFFFFGVIHDFLKSALDNNFFSRYSFILPFSLVAFIALYFYSRSSKRTFRKTTVYLNTLFIVLLLIDITLLITKISSPIKEKTGQRAWIPCTDCPKPDIYLIIADGYPGKIELRDLMQFDNTAFVSRLTKRGFNVIDSSTSNYNFTPFSIASMLNMDYLNKIQGSNSNREDMRICYTTIKQSAILQYFNSQGYELYNYSIFDFEEDPSLARPTFLPGRTSPITSQTLLKRLEKNLAHNLVTKFKIPFLQHWLNNVELKNNTKLYSKTKELASKKTNKPRFVYTHIVMPHYPYYFDSTSNKTAEELLSIENATNLELFKGYLVYANNKYLELIDHIQENTDAKAIIIFASDHGFREFKDPVDKRYHFLNLNSVYFPDGNYSGFYNGMSNVNIFRAIMNSHFNQELPMLRDSTSFLRE